MNWEALGALAEFTAAIAVILTLIYLAVQIKQSGQLVEQNNRLLDISIANATRDAQNEVSRIIASDMQAAKIFWAGLSDRSSLAEEERQSFDSMLWLQFSGARQGMQTGSEDTLAALKWTLTYPGARDWWRDYQSVFTPEAKLIVDEILST